MSQNQSLLSSIGQLLFSRACSFGNSLQVQSNKIRLNTKFDKVAIDESVYLVSHTFFSNTAMVKFSTGYRLQIDKPPKVYLKVDAGVKHGGKPLSARDLKGFQVDDDTMVKLWAFCTQKINRLVFSQSGFENKNPVDVEFTASKGEGATLKLLSNAPLIQMNLSYSDLMDIQSCILAAKQIKYYYLTDMAVIHMLDSLSVGSISQRTATEPSASDTVTGMTGAALDPFDQIKVPDMVKTKSQFKSWVIRQQPGIAISNVESKALWAIGNQKLGADQNALSNISVIQNVGSHSFAADIISKVNAGEIAFLKDMVSREYLDD